MIVKRSRPCVLAAVVVLGASPALAGGGARNVLVVVNENAAESIEIGTHFARARRIPPVNICRLVTSSSLSVGKAVYQDEIETPVEGCIAASPYADRIDYIVLTRGLPIRVSLQGGNERASTTALQGN